MPKSLNPEGFCNYHPPISSPIKPDKCLKLGKIDLSFRYMACLEGISFQQSFIRVQNKTLRTSTPLPGSDNIVIMRCKVCQAYIPEGATYCLECGAEVNGTPEIVCQRCGAAVSKRASYCRKCGAPIEHEKEASEEKSSRQSAGVTKCPRCGEEVPAGIRYCPNCGTNQDRPQEELPTSTEKPTEEKLSEKMPGPSDLVPDADECPRCGTAPRGIGRFCYNCGRFLGSDIEDVICPECGATNPLRYIRCQYCGAGLPYPSESDK